MSTSDPILLVNGPNLNTLGLRDPEIYGRETLQDIEDMARSAAAARGFELDAFQSNHEGALIDKVQAARGTRAGIVINPGAFTHSSIALLDALSFTGLPVIEVHLSNIHAREPFRHQSYISPIARGVICGLGARGYVMAIEAMTELLAA